MILDIRLEAFANPVGYLEGVAGDAVRFAYSSGYLARPDATPLSLSLPLRESIFHDHEARPYFENLLHENDQLQAVIERERISRNDIAGLLFHLGGDCAGAVTCLPADAPPVKVPGSLATDYDFLPVEAVADLAASLADTGSPPSGARDPSPVAGVQPKIAFVLAPDGRFALPKPGSGAPTTHILKTPRRADSRDVQLEAASARLAERCGLKVAVPAAIDIGGTSTLIVSRFDRVFSPDGLIRRIHQEDFAQALGLPPRLKYERNGAKDRPFNFAAALSVLKRCAEPALAVDAFLKATFFNLAIGNSDNHAKNHALIYGAGPKPRLAPLYDLLPIRISDRYTHDFAFRIGGAANAETLTGADLLSFLGAAGLSKAAASRFAKQEVAALLKTLDAAIDIELGGLKDFADLIGGEMRRLTELLDIDIALTERDCFMPRAPGWAAS